MFGCTLEDETIFSHLKHVIRVRSVVSVLRKTMLALNYFEWFTDTRILAKSKKYLFASVGNRDIYSFISGIIETKYSFLLIVFSPVFLIIVLPLIVYTIDDNNDADLHNRYATGHTNLFSFLSRLKKPMK